jgi:protein phosphatase-4 regulatory subunit 3
VANNLLEPILTVFVANGERYNLLNSVVLELFDFVWREGIKSLTVYFTDKLYPLVEEVSFLYSLVDSSTQF